MHSAYYRDDQVDWQTRQDLAATFTIRNFDFTWEHLFRFPIIGPFLRDNLPWCENVYDGTVPIADMRANETPIVALSEIFKGQAAKLYRGEELDTYPHSTEEILFALTVSDLTLEAPEPKGRGRPPGTGYDDTDSPVVQRALALKNAGEIVSKAVRKAINEADVLPGQSSDAIEKRIRGKVDRALKAAI
ncbi:hypothetical protein D3P04_10690 [Paracoccus onubensis]|uniref:Uncharacterized protein n=2 Tax=Paracoccus onubensis TaxID=1675788 RepID=A0A418SX21_9RHOB|nr:hypothetical protein D3P04_10690 [Paracoccus onubensis]